VDASTGVTSADIDSYFEKLSNWGRWGADDEIGTLNLVTPERVVAAGALVTEGVSISCARPVVTEPFAADVASPPQHFMVESGEDESAESSSDYIGLAFHGQTITHVDALCHVFWHGSMYNDRRSSLVTTHGAEQCSVEAMSAGATTRGVLLDIPKLNGVEWLDAGQPVGVAELEAAEAEQGVRVGAGDALLLRTGWSARRTALGPLPPKAGRPGLHASALPWLRERDIAILAADTANDVIPSGFSDHRIPVHTVGIVAMGLCLIDACQFEDLAAKCNELGRWEFMFTLAPLVLRSATGSPVNPIATL
jgi:kynurenine formamidase